VANLALAIAESGTSVLAIDADTNEGGLTKLLLAGSPRIDAFTQVLTGQRSISESAQPSPVNQRLSILGSGSAAATRITGAAYSRAMRVMVGEARASFDLVLIDSPAMLKVAEATDLVDSSDAALIVVGSDETVRDHMAMVEQLALIGAEVVGYIYRGGGSRPRLARHLREGGRARVARGEWEVAPSW
jgi:Mrp family chromosome partitioning ATPase